MSDIRIFNSKTNQILKKSTNEKSYIQGLIEKNIEELLGVTLVASNFDLLNKPIDKIETIGYDENNQLTIIEYRTGRFSNTINRGLMFLDYIIKNAGKIKSFLSEIIGYDKVNQINCNPRLISIGNDYNRYDLNAIEHLHYPIDLIKYQIYDKNIIAFEKNYQSQNIIINKEFITFEDDNLSSLYHQIQEFIISLGDEVCEVVNGTYISYRKIKNFIYLFIEDGILLKLKGSNSFKSIKIKNIKDFEKYQTLIEQCYDEN